LIILKLIRLLRIIKLMLILIILIILNQKWRKIIKTQLKKIIK
jgi:hypothetical protein